MHYQVLTGKLPLSQSCSENWYIYGSDSLPLLARAFVNLRTCTSTQECRRATLRTGIHMVVTHYLHPAKATPRVAELLGELASKG